MASSTNKPIQIYVRSEQHQMLRVLAARRDVSVSHLIREGIDRLLTEIPVEEDPLWDIVGMIEGGPPDLSEQHDKYLAEWAAEEHR